MIDAFGVERGDISKGLPKGAGAVTHPSWKTPTDSHGAMSRASAAVSGKGVAANAKESYVQNRIKANVIGNSGGKDLQSIRFGRWYKKKSQEMLGRAERAAAKKKRRPLP